MGKIVLALGVLLLLIDVAQINQLRFKLLGRLILRMLVLFSCWLILEFKQRVRFAMGLLLKLSSFVFEIA